MQIKEAQISIIEKAIELGWEQIFNKDLNGDAVLEGSADTDTFTLYSAKTGGVALSLKRKNSSEKVYSFIGDMTSETGIAHECIKYSRNKKLPIHFIIEDNKKSVCTDTRSAWSQKKLSYENVSDEYVTYYKYDLEYPHAGAGKRVQF